MDRYLVLLAGPPATGKTYLLNRLLEVISSKDVYVITPDEIKEMYADRYGYNNLTEKELLEQYKVWTFYYKALGMYMEAGKKIIITEYPFSDKQKPTLSYLSEKFNYKTITIRLVADFDILWKRRRTRDLDQSRHLSHLMSSYRYGDLLEHRAKADNHISKENFLKIIEKRGYNSFSLGKLVEFDVTDYDNVDYQGLLEWFKSI